MVEVAFSLLIFLGFMFLLIDVCFGMFAKVTLQHAVRSGVRYGVTSRTSTSGGSPLGHIASIKQVVQKESMGLLSDSDMGSYVTVTFYSVSSDPPAPVTGTGANAAGNLLMVSVNAWPLNPMMPLLRSSTPVNISVSSGDLIESIGGGTAPPPL